MQENTNFVSFLEDFKKDFNAYSQISNELNVILEEEKKVEELKELARVQIEKFQALILK